MHPQTSPEEKHLDAIRRSLAVVLILLFFGLVYFAKELLFPILAGFLIALTLSPLTRGLSRIGIHPGVSGSGLVLLLGLLILTAVYYSAGTVSAWMADGDTLARELRFKLSGVFSQIDDIREATEEVTQATTQAAATGPQEVVVQQPTLFSSALNVVATSGVSFAVALVLAIFLLASGDLFYRKLVQSFSTISEKKQALTMVYDVERQVSRYLLTITLINACLGLSIGVALWLLGLDYAYIWGIAAFLLNFMPYLGGVIGASMVGLYAIISFDSMSYALLVPLAYMSLTVLEGNFLTPWILGRRLELNAVAVYLTVIVWGWLWGVAGALIAVPFLVILKVICGNVERLKVVANFLGSESPNGAQTNRGVVSEKSA